MTHLKALLDDPAGLVAIHPRFEILAIALKSAVAVEYTLEKADNPYNHILDVMRMAASYFQYDFKQEQQQTPRQSLSESSLSCIMFPSRIPSYS